MTQQNRPAPWLREELLTLLSVAATLAGLCVTVVALMKTLSAGTATATIVDDMFALCAVLFLGDTYLIFWALKAKEPARVLTLVKLLDVVFLVALTLMTCAAVVMVYTVW